MYTIPPSAPKTKSFLDRYKEQNQNLPDITRGKQASYAVGNRIYNGFSNSPHSGGGLDKSGYIERDMEARTLRNNSLQRYIHGKAR